MGNVIGQMLLGADLRLAYWVQYQLDYHPIRSLIVYFVALFGLTWFFGLNK